MNNKITDAEKIIKSLDDVFNIASVGFEEFYKNATEKKSGHNSKSASSGGYSISASSGDNSKSACNGEYSKSASSGYNSTSACSGDNSTSACSGDNSISASSGEYSISASSGYNSKSSCSGENSACSALGYRAAVKGDMGNLIMASEYILKNNRYIPIGGKADIVDGKKLKAGSWYIVEGGEWVEVDFTDNIFTYVLSNKSGVKKVKTLNGEILYIVADDNGNFAHGKTIKQARADLVYKNIAKFDGDLPQSATGAEWIGIYRAITGACSAGIKNFVESTGKNIDIIYTSQEIAGIIKGQYGENKFLELLNKKNANSE